ncbi:MAG: S46 family peptidase [Bacteroidales bacterium]|nr:S46 family peptidase [Bacteroidales bacterium]
MKKIVIVLFIILLGLNPIAKADEGMWLPMFIERLNYVDMQKMGLQLTAEEIYSINNSSLKDAIIIFDRGCTGEIVSDQGLVFTNHHCGFSQIQSHSTVEHDYLTDGFWAMNKNEELSNPGTVVKFLISMENVTDDILSQVNNNMTEEERAKTIKEVASRIKKKAEHNNHFDAVIKSFFGGNEFYLFIYEIFKDVRLVGAPPTSIGKFGADTDNWMWPRHTGDFSIFRIYTAPDGKPAEYSKENIPLKPKHYLPISIKGFEKNDFAMILGYPGGTDRYLTSYGVKLATDKTNPAVVKIRQRKLDILREDMDASNEIRIKYASKYARTANYWKYFIGQTKGLKRLKVYDKKKQIEEDFQKWADADAKRKAKYGESLKYIAEAYNDITTFQYMRWYFNETVSRGCEILGFARKFSGLVKLESAENKDDEKISEEIKSLKETSENYFKNYNVPTDKKLFAAMMEMFYTDVPKDLQPDLLIKYGSKYKGDFNKLADRVFSKSIFYDQDKVNAFLDNPKVKTIKKDIAYILMKDFFNNYFSIKKEYIKADELLKKGNRLFIAGLREMKPDKKFYPDANFTMRLSYGRVLDYYPADAIHFDYVTTLKGVMEKEDPGNWEFTVPEKLQELYKQKDFGEYGDNGIMTTCFLTDHDITGGNSGSPVINGKGELIGLAFDGNWEAMSGDIAFEPELQRTINVDIRYVLFIIDKFAGAKNLINEMTIVK